MKGDTVRKDIFLDLSIDEGGFDFSASVADALVRAKAELSSLNETIDSVRKLKPDCDSLDYILAASLGALCGVIDIFLVGKPGESPVGNVTDQWFSDRTMDFAKHCHPQHKNFDNSETALRFLEKRFKVPYDQTGLGDAGNVNVNENLSHVRISI